MCKNLIFSRKVFRKPWSPSGPCLFLIILIFTVCFFSLNAQAGEVTLTWTPPSAEYKGFILSYGTVSGAYTDSQDVGALTTHTVSGLNEGETYFFAVKAYDSNAIESFYSAEVNVAVPVIDTIAPATPKSVSLVSGG